MDRMKTFFKYFLLIIGFFIATFIIQFLAFKSMYVSIKDNGIVAGTTDIMLDVTKIKATNVNGFINLNVTNNSENSIKDKFIKIDLIDSQDLLAATKYVKLADIKKEESYSYRVTFKANHIESYKISIVDKVPEYSQNIVNILGIDVDIDNLVMTVNNTANNLPDFVYALVGVFLTIKTGKLLWGLYLLM